MIRGATIRVRASHVLIRHIAIRTGDAPTGNVPCESRDSIVIMDENNSGAGINDIVIDHVSCSFAIDETFTWSKWDGGVSRSTLSNSFITKSLHHSCHPKVYHGKGVLVSQNVNHVTMHHCLLESHMDRNPRVSGGTEVEIVNNLIYNPNYQADIGYGGVSTPYSIHYLGNYFKRGPNEHHSPEEIIFYEVDVSEEINRNTRVYIHDNWSHLRPTGSEEDWIIVKDRTHDYVAASMRSNSNVFTTSGIIHDPPIQAYNDVLNSSGSRPWERDAYDLDTVNNVINSAGGVINCVEFSTTPPQCSENAGGWITYASKTRSLTLPDDYMTIETNGYTKLENWIFSFDKYKDDGNDNNGSGKKWIIPVGVTVGVLVFIMIIIFLTAIIIIFVKVKKKHSQPLSKIELTSDMEQVLVSKIDESSTLEM